MSWKKTKQNPLDPRALLDELMGADRNFSAEERERLGPTWRDQGVCRRFLAGCCPPELFNTSNHYKIGTRVIIDAACTQKHSQTLREQFMASGAPEIAQYQKELIPYLEKLCTDADQEVSKALQRVAGVNQLNEVPPRIRKLKEEQLELQARAKALLLKAEEAGNEGDVDAAANCTAEAEALQRRIHDLESQVDAERVNPKNSDAAMMQTVCAICGSINSLADDADEKHLLGNRHLTWAEIRRCVAELKAKFAAGGGAHPFRDGGRSASADRDRGRDRERDKSSDRDRERDHRDRGKSRDGDAKGGEPLPLPPPPERRRERSRSRSRSRERRRERDRERDRERERSGRGGGDRSRDDRRRSRSRDRGGSDRGGGDRRDRGRYDDRSDRDRRDHRRR